MDQFVRGNSTNLPKVDIAMILEFMSTNDKHNVAEIRGAKALLSSRDSYVNSAVGYAEVKRNQECIVQAKIVPEHRVSAKHYSVMATINEKDHVIIDSSCDGCAAAAGGCKHSLVFLFWLEKRSSEPAPTSTICYWKKPQLSRIRSEKIKSEDIFKNTKKIKLEPKDPNILRNLLNMCSKEKVSKSLITCFQNEKENYNIFDLAVKYLAGKGLKDFSAFFKFLNEIITKDVIDDLCLKTEQQAHSNLWHILRQGRITASKIFEVSRCQTDGTLVQQILGGYKNPETEFIKRGKQLETSVLEVLKEKLGVEVSKSGFILINGLIGASPDGVGKDFVVEIKCPSSSKTLKSYIDSGNIGNKYYAQMQVQMLAAKKAKAVFCIADPKFEDNNKVEIHWVDYDSTYTNNLLERAIEFWKKYVFEKIFSYARI